MTLDQAIVPDKYNSVMLVQTTENFTTVSVQMKITVQSSEIGQHWLMLISAYTLIRLRFVNQIVERIFDNSISLTSIKDTFKFRICMHKEQSVGNCNLNFQQTL